jgi:hypothetical protein
MFVEWCEPMIGLKFIHNAWIDPERDNKDFHSNRKFATCDGVFDLIVLKADRPIKSHQQEAASRGCQSHNSTRLTFRLNFLVSLIIFFNLFKG